MNKHDLLGVIVRATGLTLFAMAGLQAFNLMARILGIRVATHLSMTGDLWGVGALVILGFEFIQHADRIVSFAYRNGRASKDISK